MNILIKGMEMPKDCNKCPMTVEGYCRIIGYPNGDAMNKRYKPLWCPLVEIPPHGRLIDVDEFEKYVELEYETREISHPNWIKFRVWCGDQPTIIEAEGGE